ncbi:MAG: hypothetical protein J1E62_06580 [Lachnospiraceae bacterium]|nr:hypothetical protein [Lachnospiraceae bacterium]
MKIIKNSFSIIIWILLITLSTVLLSNLAHEMGEYKIAAWEYVQSLFAHSALFWAMGILLLIQVLFINLKSFRQKNRIVATITIIIIIMSVMFYRHIIRIMTSYNTIIQDTNGVSEIGLAVLNYRKYFLVYVIVTNVLSIVNIIITTKNTIKNDNKS